MDFMTFLRETPLWFLIPVGILYVCLCGCAIYVCIKMFTARK